jgi:hypothetical protein
MQLGRQPLALLAPKPGNRPDDLLQRESWGLPAIWHGMQDVGGKPRWREHPRHEAVGPIRIARRASADGRLFLCRFPRLKTPPDECRVGCSPRGLRHPTSAFGAAVNSRALRLAWACMVPAASFATRTESSATRRPESIGSGPGHATWMWPCGTGTATGRAWPPCGCPRKSCSPSVALSSCRDLAQSASPPTS